MSRTNSIMHHPTHPMDRRQAIVSAAGACALAARPAWAEAPQKSDPKRRKICAFIKFVQELSYDELAGRLAAMGYDGVEATVRKGGYVLPERVEQDLPALVAALKKEGLEVTVMASDINDPEDPLSRRVMETAASLGVRRYRMRYFRYAFKAPVRKELQAFRDQAHRLAEANKRLGLSAVYQNHAGARYLGATIWDLAALLDKIPPEQIGVAFDVRHATATGGESWPVLWDVAKPHVTMVYVKDFQWKRAKPDARQKMENVALGKGQVHPDFFQKLKALQTPTADAIPIPISVHVEYLGEQGVAKNLAAMAADLTTLRKMLGET